MNIGWQYWVLILGGLWLLRLLLRPSKGEELKAARARRDSLCADPYRDRFDLASLAERLGMSEAELSAFVPAYNTRVIDKRGPYRSGAAPKRKKAGKRLLHIPEPDTKALQRTILRRILADLRVHSAASAYEPGCNVAENAAMHAHQALVIKIDFVDFFPSVTVAMVEAYFQRIGWTREASEVLARICTHEGGLPQGAPTSPAISNRVCFGLDHAMSEMVSARRGIYTRYADDITLSFPKDYPKKMRGVVQAAGRIAKRYGFQIHRKKKLHMLRRHQSQQVTGLVVNDGVRLPRKTRRWLRAVAHRMETGGEATLTPEQLAGWLAYKDHVDNTRQTFEQTEAATSSPSP